MSPSVFKAQLVEHCTTIAEVIGSNSVGAALILQVSMIRDNGPC